MGLFSIFKKAKVHQIKNSTSFDRYPNIFKASKKYFFDKKVYSPKILSFGCSTGEECFSLRNYFPDSKIIGLDIDHKSLSFAKENNSDSNIFFDLSSKRNMKKYGKFDLIFCMSVLCRWPDSQNKESISEIYPFENFESALKEIIEELNTGGLLIIYNSNFRFTDSKLSEKFLVIQDESIVESGFVHKFNSNNKLDNDTNYAFCIFKKEKD